MSVPETTTQQVQPVHIVAVDDILHVPHDCAAHLVTHEEEALHKKLGHQPRDRILITNLHDVNRDTLAKARLVILTSHIDRLYDHGGSVTVGMSYLRMMCGYKGTVFVITFTGVQGSAPQLIAVDANDSTMFVERASSADQIFAFALGLFAS